MRPFSTRTGNMKRSGSRPRMRAATRTKDTAIAWERFPVDILFAARLFLMFPPFFPISLATPSLFLSPPHPPSPPPSTRVFRTLYSHQAFSFDESRWNYPLHSRDQWRSFRGGGGRRKDGEGGEEKSLPEGGGTESGLGRQ